MDKRDVNKPDVYLMARSFVRVAERGFLKDKNNPYGDFFDHATPAENEIIMNAGRRKTREGVSILQEPGMREYLKLADIYAAIAGRTGQEALLRPSLPAETRTTEFSLRALRRGAPAFAMLCCPVKFGL